MHRLTALLTSIWLGLHLGFGYIAAPVLFHRLVSVHGMDKVQVGSIAGTLFHWSNWLGLIAWACAYVVMKQDAKRSYKPSKMPLVVILLWVLLAANEFLFSSVITALSNNQSHWLSNLIGGGRGVWHGSSSMVHLVVAFLGLILCAIMLRWREPYR